ncbi:MAG: DEAD/DEAH box helicase, partial [Alphaproteobacteria bacterium]
MRPQILFPLFAPVTVLPGVGTRIAKLIERLAGPRVVDLCWHLPSGLIDRRYTPKIAQAEIGRIATLTVTVVAHRPSPGPRRPYRILCRDETGEIELVFFHAKPDYLAKVLPEGSRRAVSGKVESFGGHLQMTHPDHIAPAEDLARLTTVEPVYPLTAGLTLKPLVKAVRGALARAPELPEWLDPALRERHGWLGWRAALMAAHAPTRMEDLSPSAPARARLAYDELLANQLALALVRRQQRAQRGRALRSDGRLRAKALATLPFRLTRSQEQAVSEILGDMAHETRMLRLLQGDVGSGKTVVALLAMLNAVEAGAQAALMAPTEILARQHFQTIA